MPELRLCGLYVVTPEPRHPVADPPGSDSAGPPDPTVSLVRQIEQALDGGARLVQYRDKSTDPARRRRDSEALLSLCRHYKVPLIINDDLDLALTIGADGVHLGHDDANPSLARALLGPDRLIGVSCYNDFELAVAAAEDGADYIAFGSFFPSPTKPQAVRAEPALLRRAREHLALPTVAIGGITPENGGALISEGADMLAVISAVFGQADGRAAARSFSDLFEQPEDHPQ